MATNDTVLHPRPRVTRPHWTDLNGTWQFAYDDANSGIREHWQVDAAHFDRQIVVPFPPESELSGISDKGFHPILWYRRSFTENAPAGGRLILTSSEGQIAYVNPADGSIQATVDTRAPFSLPPVVANNTLYTLDDSGRLTAYR